MTGTERIEALEKLKQDICISTNNLVQCSIVREEYTIRLLEFLFEKLEIEKPDLQYDFNASIKNASLSDDKDRKR